MSMDSILTPSEMDALLQPSEADVGAAPQDVRPLDLITRDHQAFALLPQLNEAGKSLAAHVGRICSQQLRMPCQAEPSAVEVMPASRLEDMVGSPRFTYSVKANGRSGAGALTIDGLLGAAFVERQFGGDINDLQDPGGAPSPTEQRAVGRLASYVVLAFQKVLSDLTAMELELEYFPPSLLGQMTQGVSVVHLTMKISLESKQWIFHHSRQVQVQQQRAKDSYKDHMDDVNAIGILVQGTPDSSGSIEIPPECFNHHIKQTE